MSKLDYAEVKAQTQKDPTDRLLAEGTLGQTARGRDFLEALDREQLVEFVALMRISLGQKESVKSEIKGYDPDKAKEKFLKATVTAAQAAIAGTQTEMEKLMSLMMKQMEIAEKNKKEERDEMAKKEERLREIAEKNKKEERDEMVKNRQVEMEIAEKNRQMEIAYRQSIFDRDTKLKEEAEAKDRTMQLALADKELQQMQERQAILESVKIMQKTFEEKSDRDAARVKEKDDKREIRFQKASKLLKNILYILPTEAGTSSLLIYFRNLEEVFLQYAIEPDIQGLVLFSKLPEKVRKLLGNIPAEQKDTYEKVKNIILAEYQLTAGICYRGFIECVKFKMESMIQYASRLRSLLQCYLDARKVTTFVDLMDLMVCDQMKSSLTQSEKYFIGEKESGGCLKSIEIARLIDVHQAIRLEERGKDKRTDYRPDYRKTGANEANKQYNSSYGPSKEVDVKSGGIKAGSYNGQKPRSMAQVVMKEERPNKSFQNNSQHKSTTYRTRKVEVQDDNEPSNEQTSSEGEQEQEEESEDSGVAKNVMRVGIEKGLIKKLHPEQREKDRESVTPGERSEERRVGKECRSRWSPYH